ncbi:hypothetical protein L9F63_022882 [Diploptera punctata]|uniref:Uncharacterized protein n=1 Tax=Diploptera punctata TaxID=6984 RepID=A0AAD7ZLW8_DIPPU|nr:hypothetical protein L9F63_022882 [Diploptera punctata]
MQYYVPTDASYWHTKPEITARRDVSHNRQLEMYLPLESFLEDYGFDGRECLLRIICESAQVPFQHDETGLLEEIAHAVLTPSEELYLADGWCHNYTSTWTPNATNETHYLAAECLGRSNGDCSSAYPIVPRSPLDFISQQINYELVSG